MSLEENKKLVERVRSTWLDSNNPKGVLPLLHPDCEYYVVASDDTFRGIDEIEKMIERAMAPRDAHFEVPNAFAGEEQIFWEWINQGTLSGPTPDFFDETGTRYVAPAGTKYSFKICAVAQVKDGKLYRIREYYDRLSVIRQIRAAAEAAEGTPSR